MADTSSIRITKSFTYRGSTRLWSNRYHLLGDIPTSDGGWSDLLDAVTAHEQPIYESGMTIVQGDAFNPDSDVSVFTKAYSLVGSGSFSGARATAGDAAAVVRYTTDQRSTKNHPIYLFNYFHGVFGGTSSANDTVNPAQVTAYQAYVDAWVAGIAYSGGSDTVLRAGPRGAAAVAGTVLPFIRHRDFT